MIEAVLFAIRGLASWAVPAAPLAPAGLWAATRAPARARFEILGTDEELVARVLAGDGGAFDELYLRYVDDVWRWLTRLLGPDPDREDVAQHVFVEVLRSLGRFRQESAFRTYLYRITINAAIDHLKRRRGRRLELPTEALDAFPAADATPEATTLRRERLALIWRVLETIKPKKRVALLLRIVEGLSLEEIGERTQATVPAVAQRIRHAQRELHALLARRGEGDGE
jgi:RNA polymerase sigma-70 factor, ECF subfamily